MFLLVACDRPHPSPKFPDAGDVARIASGRAGSVPIEDEARIRAFIQGLNALTSERWSTTWHTYASPDVTYALLSRTGQTICLVDLGRNWLGSDCGVGPLSPPRWFPTVRLTPAQDRFFRGPE